MILAAYLVPAIGLVLLVMLLCEIPIVQKVAVSICQARVGFSTFQFAVDRVFLFCCAMFTTISGIKFGGAEREYYAMKQALVRGDQFQMQSSVDAASSRRFLAQRDFWIHVFGLVLWALIVLIERYLTSCWSYIATRGQSSTLEGVIKYQQEGKMEKEREATILRDQEKEETLRHRR
eukprot:GHVP01000269.1.p1 GENE.GHVP01000269.1~~GHVP01000269.1.p1  ORF type:complete len:177 (-),score=12.43 GHVP01000269.1:56-586(-)